MRVASTGRLHASGRYKERKWGVPGASCLRSLQRQKVGRAWGFMPQGVTKTESGAWLGLHASGRYKDRKWGVTGASCLRALQRQKMGRGWGFMPQRYKDRKWGVAGASCLRALQRQKMGRGWGFMPQRYKDRKWGVAGASCLSVTKTESGAWLGLIHTPSTAFRHLTPNSARFSYATEGAFFISVQLSSDAVSALRKVPVLI